MRIWLSLALLSSVAGCAGDHMVALGTDAATTGDAGICMGSPETRDGDVLGLVCPTSVSTGDPITVALTTSINQCCGDDAALAPVVSGHDAQATITAPYNLCNCCLACRCIGPSVTREVVVSPAASGGSFHVIAGEHECTIAIDPPAMCTEATITSAHVPLAVPLGSTVPVHVASNASNGCSCRPRASVDAAGQISLAACDCCLDCPCIDLGYEATVQMAAPTTLDVVAVSVAGTLPPMTTTIVDPMQCTTSDATITELVPLAPDAQLHQVTPTGAWVQLRAFERRCCGEPLPLVTSVMAPDGSIELTVAECRPDPCDCASDEPHDASTPVYLGALASGTHTVRAGSVSTTITIP